MTLEQVAGALGLAATDFPDLDTEDKVKEFVRELLQERALIEDEQATDDGPIRPRPFGMEQLTRPQMMAVRDKIKEMDEIPQDMTMDQILQTFMLTSLPTMTDEERMRLIADLTLEKMLLDHEMMVMDMHDGEEAAHHTWDHDLEKLRSIVVAKVEGDFVVIPKIASKAELVDFFEQNKARANICLLYTSPSPRDRQKSRMPSSA